MGTSGRTRKLDATATKFSTKSLMSATPPKCSDTGAYKLVTSPVLTTGGLLLLAAPS